MKFKELGRTREKIPAIGMGTWQLQDNADALEALKAGLNAGCRFIDTAEIYGTEAMVGQAIKGERDVFIATKVWVGNLRYDDVIKACDASLKRLGVKQIDLYQVHWPNYKIPISETMRAMERLVDDGKIRYIGVSNFSAQEVMSAQSELKREEIVSDQVEYSILTRDAEHGLTDFCQRNSISLIAYSPLGTGAFFSDKYSHLRDVLGEIGKRHNASAAQVALAWVIAKDPVVAIPRTGKRKHVLENIAAGEIELDKDEYNKIAEAVKGYKKMPLGGGRVFQHILKRTTFWHGFVQRRNKKDSKD